jgi:eukaryotic-like serine/threonine-protein kinase
MSVVESTSLPGIRKYEILGEIGHGGMATVYRARDARLGREVALKVIHRHLRENLDVARRFASEALTVARVKHPNIVEVYDVSGEDEVERYLVVELIRGKTLRELLAQFGPLPPEVAASIAVLVLRALSHAHAHGVIHRDVKPENVMLVTERATKDPAEPRVKLTDFGIAKLLDAEGVTHTGQVLGSPAHMAPEQIEGGDVDARSDVFGVGVLLHEMLTGTLPFEGKNPAQVLRRVLEGGTTPADRIRPEVGSAYAQIATQALARSPADRQPSADAMQKELLDELASLGVSDPTLEVAHFLDSPDAYLRDHPNRIVDALSSRGLVRRRDGDYLGSSVDYNRALAYRPDDTLLLSEVAGLGRRRRAHRRLRLLAKVGLSLAVLLGAGAIFHNFAPSLGGSPRPRRAASELTKGSAPMVRETGPSPSKPQSSQTPNEPARGPTAFVTPKPTSTKKGKPLPKPHRETEVGVREVRTPVAGPQNARVRIDGQILPWFQLHQLGYGPHTFEFVPPNVECCEQPLPITVEIVPGEGPQIVRGTIRFKDALLKFDGQPGARASCGIVGAIFAGGARPVPMSRPEERVICTLFPAPGAAGEPRSIDVDLRPGRTFTLLER